MFWQKNNCLKYKQETFYEISNSFIFFLDLNQAYADDVKVTEFYQIHNIKSFYEYINLKISEFERDQGNQLNIYLDENFSPYELESKIKENYFDKIDDFMLAIASTFYDLNCNCKDIRIEDIKFLNKYFNSDVISFIDKFDKNGIVNKQFLKIEFT